MHIKKTKETRKMKETQRLKKNKWTSKKEGKNIFILARFSQNFTSFKSMHHCHFNEYPDIQNKL